MMRALFVLLLVCGLALPVTAGPGCCCQAGGVEKPVDASEGQGCAGCGLAAAGGAEGGAAGGLADHGKCDCVFHEGGRSSSLPADAGWLPCPDAGASAIPAGVGVLSGAAESVLASTSARWRAPPSRPIFLLHAALLT